MVFPKRHIDDTTAWEKRVVMIPRRRASLLLALSAMLAPAACATEGSRKSEIVDVLLRADDAQLRSRRELVAEKFRAMSESSHAFLRGCLALARHDWHKGGSSLAQSRFALPVTLVPTIGDPHVENFGAVDTNDGFHFALNDFDAADEASYLFDLRRLSISLLVGANLARAQEPLSEDDAIRVERAVAEGYVAGLNGEDAGASAIFDDTMTKAPRDLGDALGELTVLEDGARTVVRGVPDPTDPESRFESLPAWAAKELSHTLERFGVAHAQAVSPRYFELLDAAREFGGGISSRARVRVIAVVRGETDEDEDDVVFEVKELADSGALSGTLPYAKFSSVQDRVEKLARWFGDPLYGAESWLGFPVQIKREGLRSVRIRRWTDELATTDAFVDVGYEMGRVLALFHTSGSADQKASARVRETVLRDAKAFIDEQAALTHAEAPKVEEDYALFLEALKERGEILGFHTDTHDANPTLDRLIYGKEALK